MHHAPLNVERSQFFCCMTILHFQWDLPLTLPSPRDGANKAGATRGERMKGVHPPQWQWFCPPPQSTRRGSSTAHRMLRRTGHCYGGREGTCTFYATLGFPLPFGGEDKGEGALRNRARQN